MMSFNPQLPFLVTLELLEVSKLTNDPILHNPYWPPVPTKIPSDYTKFEGKCGEDPQEHVMTYHLLCSSNSSLDGSIHLSLFQRTLTGFAAKWYIELARGTFQDFNSLSMAFLMHFQLLIHYEMGTHLITSLKQDMTTHIFDHIHEWRRRHCLIKFQIPNQLLTDWFTTSFINLIAKDIAMGACVTKEKAIVHAQYLDLVYSQSSTLYDFFLDGPRPGTYKALSTPYVNGVIGYVAQYSQKSSMTPMKQKSIAPTETASQSPSNPKKTSEVNVIQSTVAEKTSKGKKKGKGKNKSDMPKQETPKTHTNDGSKHKPKYPCLIYDVRLIHVI